MKTIISSVTFLLLITACSDAKLAGTVKPGAASGGSPSQSDDASSSANNEGIINNVPAVDPSVVGGGSKDEGALVNVPAVIPAAIGGASLTCTVSAAPRTLGCETYKDGQLYDFLPTAMFAVAGDGISSTPTGWLDLPFETVKKATYKASVPDTVPSRFIVSLRSDKGEYISTMVGNGTIPFAYKSLDGSFEDLKGEPGYKDYAANEIPGSVWKIASNNTSACANGGPVLRVYTAEPKGIAAANGSTWVSLDSRCANDKDSLLAGGNYTLSQKLSGLKVGKTYYVSFQARVDSISLGKQEDAQVSVEWGSADTTTDGKPTSLLVAPTSTTWQSFGFSVKAGHEEVTLNFVGKGTANHHGVMLDDVRVLEMGAETLP